MLIIREAQLSALREAMEEPARRGVAERLAARLPIEWAALGDPGAERFLVAVFSSARRAGFVELYQVERFASLLLLSGVEPEGDPFTLWPVLDDTGLSPDRKLAALH